MSNKSESKASRRDFLKLAGTAAPAAVAAVAVGAPDTAAASPVDLSSDRMQDTEHTRAYLESTRF
ncbi:twin-arginine translocation signal domain-containing protein [Sulfitobacter sabulilitoris]|uniref:Twin-arginine translocation signal domain-containing protein n=1 Tax=Sulfitobacter sabulilitoris TaxID=2562655 RepID=A0A5S3PBM0_9RHOB|nr:twin-arginine translocation signal domain-containing protein [Sulfitobacter sabulilitoris]TMM51082.1 twin-arginine translocation signal domain-containing protein [Sulfitobacter sabulilitoris]